MFLENGVFAPNRKQVVLTENGENDDLHSAHKNKGFCPQNPENDENDENGGCHSGKTRVYQKRGFHNPEKTHPSKNINIKISGTSAFNGERPKRDDDN